MHGIPGRDARLYRPVFRWKSYLETSFLSPIMRLTVRTLHAGSVDYFPLSRRYSIGTSSPEENLLLRFTRHCAHVRSASRRRERNFFSQIALVHTAPQAPFFPNSHDVTNARVLIPAGVVVIRRTCIFCPPASAHYTSIAREVVPSSRRAIRRQRGSSSWKLCVH